MERLVKLSVVTAAGLFCGFLNKAGYAAEDANSFGQLLDKIKAYDFGKSRADLVKISEEISKARGKPEIRGIEKQLDEFLKSDATYAAKDFVCRELSVIGTEASVPVLATMLTEESRFYRDSDMARYALERIPGDAVDKALREALPKAAGNAKTGIINTIGVRGDKQAVGLLSGLISDANQTVAVAAAAALGGIDDASATDALAKAKDKATGTLRTQVLDAYLRCADRLASKEQKETASKIYKELYVPSEAVPVCVAAVRGMIITAGDKTADTVVEALKSGDTAIQTAAVATLKEVNRTDVIKAAAEQLPNLAAAQQAQLLAALADCEDKAALSTALSAVKSTDTDVRAAALNAIGVLGDATSVDVLVDKAADSRGAEQKAAQDALYQLRGTDVDVEIVKKIADAEPKAKVELIRSCDQRNITASAPVLMKAVQDSDGRVRTEAIKAMRTVAGPQDLAGLIDLQLAATGADRTELEKTVVAVAGKIPQDKGRAEKVLAALSAAKTVDARGSLLSVLGKIGDPAGLPVLREALADKEEKVKDAAVRGLSDWPTSAPAADLLEIAKKSENEVQKTLALRGYVRLIGLESDKPAEELIKEYQEAMTLAPSAAEKRMVLSGLTNVRSFEALQMAGGCLDDAELKQEAETAVVKIAESTISSNPKETKELLQKVLEETTSETVREQAQRLLKIQ